MTGKSLVRRLSIRAVLWAVALGLTLVGLAVWQYWRVSLHALDARLLEDARIIAQQITVTRDDALDIDVPIELTATLDREQRYYGVYDRDGRLLDGRGAPPSQTYVDSSAPPLRTREGYREAHATGARDATVVVGRALDPIYGDVRRLAASLLVASLGVLALALPLILWLRRQLARSIGRIDETVRALTPGQTSRIETARLDAEFVGVADAFNEAFDRLEGALARERQLTSDASHELRTPVSTLVAETEWALARPRSEEEYRRSLEVCARQARRMKDLAESLLTLARLEAGSSPPRQEPVSLRAVADEAAAELTTLARERRVALRVDGDAHVTGDRVQLRILLTNLLSNAVKYNRPDGEVRVQLSNGGGTARVDVTDTGAGMTADQVAHVFDRFWRADVSRTGRDAGSGLGLAISKAVVAAHRGTIVCRSTPDEGTTFSVALPG